jgi:hypothetical protein
MASQIVTAGNEYWNMTKHKVVGGTVLCSEAARQVYKTRLSYFSFCTVLQRGEEGLASWHWTKRRNENWEILRMAGDDSPQIK